MRVIKIQRRWLDHGPFFWPPNGSAIFYLTAEEASGKRRRFWVRGRAAFFATTYPSIRKIIEDKQGER